MKRRRQWRRSGTNTLGIIKALHLSEYLSKPKSNKPFPQLALSFISCRVPLIWVLRCHFATADTRSSSAIVAQVCLTCSGGEVVAWNPCTFIFHGVFESLTAFLPTRFQWQIRLLRSGNPFYVLHFILIPGCYRETFPVVGFVMRYREAHYQITSRKCLTWGFAWPINRVPRTKKSAKFL